MGKPKIQQPLYKRDRDRLAAQVARLEDKLEAVEGMKKGLGKRLKAGQTVVSTALVRDGLDRILKGASDEEGS